MSILINRFYRQIVAAGGGIGITTPPMRGLLKHLIIRADTDSTTFDFSLTDGSSLQLFERESIDGEINETLDMPIQSALQLNVSASTRDELFKVYLAVEEIG